MTSQLHRCCVDEAMTAEQLIAEGRKIQRPTTILKPHGAGKPVAMWVDSAATDDGRLWMTLRCDAIPNSKAGDSNFLSLHTKGCESGFIQLIDDWPAAKGTPLYAHPASILPPIEAVFVLGSEEIGAWLAANNWPRTERYNSNFPGAAIVRNYERIWFSEHPIYKNDPDIYAAIGGWHFPAADSDWHDLVPATLLLTTFRDSEPWVEVFELPNGEYKVIQRIT